MICISTEAAVPGNVFIIVNLSFYFILFLIVRGFVEPQHGIFCYVIDGRKRGSPLVVLRNLLFYFLITYFVCFYVIGFMERNSGNMWYVLLEGQQPPTAPLCHHKHLTL